MSLLVANFRLNGASRRLIDLPQLSGRRQTGLVVRTGARAAALQKLLNRGGLRSVASGPPAPRLDVLPGDARAELIELYQALGGKEPIRALRPGAWDLAFIGGLVVELDEELHFNRYRLRTLQAPWNARLPWHDAYLDLCDRHEQACLGAGRWGKRWTSRSCESMFGPPGEAGVLEGAGAPRWKQRALYDAIKDIAALTSNALHLVRLSVWDTIDDVRLGDALSGGAPIDDERLRELVAERTTSPLVA